LFAILSAISSDILSGISSDILSVLSSDILSGIFSDIPSDILSAFVLTFFLASMLKSCLLVEARQGTLAAQDRV